MREVGDNSATGSVGDTNVGSVGCCLPSSLLSSSDEKSELKSLGSSGEGGSFCFSGFVVKSNRFTPFTIQSPS